VAQYETVDYVPGPVARVILDRPERHNAQSWTLLAEMEAAFNEAVADPECRVIVLSGAGRSFSAGHDLDSPEQLASRHEQMAGLDPFNATAKSWDVYVNSHLRWRDLQKPTIAMVHGWCLFGGWMIAAAMDFIFAADDAMFIPVYGDYFTAPWDLGPRKAKEVLFGNQFMTAEEAKDWGFVNRVIPAADLEKETLKYARRVAEHDPFTIRTIKLAINQTTDGMGFTQSVRAVGASFIRRPAQAAAARPADPRQAPMRSQIARAMQYLQEDRGE
jgi:enoyl-CoA hydratase/carnithine racemase